MISSEIKHNVQNLLDNFTNEEFIYDLMITFRILKISLTRLKKGDYNLSKAEGEIADYINKRCLTISQVFKGHFFQINKNYLELFFE